MVQSASRFQERDPGRPKHLSRSRDGKAVGGAIATDAINGKAGFATDQASRDAAVAFAKARNEESICGPGSASTFLVGSC